MENRVGISAPTAGLGCWNCCFAWDINLTHFVTKLNASLLFLLDVIETGRLAFKTIIQEGSDYDCMGFVSS